MAYDAITIEGGLFPADLLDRVASGDEPGQRPQDFGLASNGRLSDEIQSAFSDVRAYWDAFQRRLVRASRASESPTTLTREFWVTPLLETLGWTELPFQRAAAQAGGESYAVSHRGGEDPDAPPVHIVALDQALDRKDGARRSPHALVQEYLNRSDNLWGLVTNGERLRLLRDSERVAHPSFLEFDLRGLVEGNRYAEFALLYRLLHRSRFPRAAAEAPECWLERTYQAGIEQGGRVREHLRVGVEEALKVLGTALLAQPESGELRDALRGGRLDAPGYYRQLLRLIYRLLFLFVAEERRLIFPPDARREELQAIYSRYYALGRLRDRAERRFAGDRHGDLWQGLLETFRVFRDSETAARLGLAALDGELFGPRACEDLETAGCENMRLLQAIYHLSTFLDETHVTRRVNYAALDVEELGSVYESLLDYHPRVELDGGSPRFELVSGAERKTTGSYYTPPSLVHELVESALVPVVEERLAAAGTSEARERALLGLRVVDPASGSGHFLLAAARRIARELATVRSGEAEPAPEEYRHALRDVIRHCVYAVDKNPLAVDLCKVALWIEGHSAGLPLSFLDAHVKCGDSLVGVLDLAVLAGGIPDDAYTAVAGDDRKVASALKKRNKQERARSEEGYQQRGLGLERAVDLSLGTLAPDFAELGGLEERTPADVQAKAGLYDALRGEGGRWWVDKVACDLWTAAFFTPLAQPANGPELAPTSDTVRRYLEQPQAADGRVVGNAVGLSAELRFFHWPLEFPDVFERGGFDVVLGNPPWERIKLQEKEFFAARDPEIARAPNKAARERLTKALPERDPALAREFADASHAAEAQSKFVRTGGRFPLTGRGDVNTYAIFAETMRELVGPVGRAGMIVPSGIATDATTQFFFRDLMSTQVLVSLYSFENDEKLFPSVHNEMKFCLLTITGVDDRVSAADFVFFARQPVHLHDAHRHFTLTADDVALLNPNTRTCPIFRTNRDAEITRAIYLRVPVLIEEGPQDENPWGISFLRMFDMSTDSGLFRTREQMETAGWRLGDNDFIRGGERYLPLYEGKMISQFDHRFGTYEGQTQAQANKGFLPQLSPSEHEQPYLLGLPRYWISEQHVDERIRSRWDRRWLLAFRKTARNTDVRTLITAVLPHAGVGDKVPLILPAPADTAALLAACLNSFASDYLCRQKAGGTDLSNFVVEQIAVLPPLSFQRDMPWDRRGALSGWLTDRVLELTYTARDLQPFARDLGHDGPPFRWDEARRFLLRCELDAAFFHLYGIARADVDYIMDTFPIVRRKDEAAHGEYRTKRVILEVYDAMAEASRSGVPYRTRLDPPPADPRVAHPAPEPARSATMGTAHPATRVLGEE